MEKPQAGASAMEHLLYGLSQIDDERQEPCIHCAKVWYVIQHRDGVCHTCQRNKLPGRRELMREAAQRRIMKQMIVLVLLLLAGLFIFHGCGPS